MSSPPPRPSQVTFAAGVIIVGSVLLVLSVFEQISGLRSLETQEAVQDFLAEPPGDGLGLSVDDVLLGMRILSMIAAACATAAAILGVYVLRRSRPARIGLTALAAPLMVTGLVVGGFIAAMVAVAAVMLWLQPARDWYDGRAPRPPAPRPEPQRVAPPEAGPTAALPTSAPPSAEPRPYAGFGTAAAPQPPYPYGAPPPPARRPGAVLWACALTWAFSGLVAVGMVLAAVVVAMSPEQLMDELRRQDAALAEDVSEDLLVATTIAMTVVLLVWCVVAAVAAWFTFRQAAWAQITLIVSAAGAGLICLVGTLVGSFPLVVLLAGCSTTVALLLRPESRAWFAARGRGTIPS